jgi:2-polyprenyl-3-methyl-5-hydroxy-6-metoxy-1,4-benzoquinol methylase
VPSTDCQICGQAQRTAFARHDAIALYRCTACGFVAMDPLPGADMLAALYSDTYAGASESYFTKISRKLRRSRGRIRHIRRFLADRATHGRRFLDVGCNGGFMVEAAREAGFDATGLEPDGAAIAWAKRHYPANTYVHGLLGAVALPDQGFDAVYCSEVIEHAPDSNGFVAALAAALKPGGVLYLTTPDIDHWRRPRDLARWDAFCPPAHCVYFNPRNLTLLLQRHGLAVVHRAIAFKPGIKLVARKAA